MQRKIKNFVKKIAGAKNWIIQSKIINKKTIINVILLFSFLYITNPLLIPFLSKRIKEDLTKALISIFGDVTSVSKIIPLNWIIIFQLILMVLVLTLLMHIIKRILEYIKPKNSRIKTFLTLFINTLQYLFTIIGIIWALKIFGVNTTTIFASVGIVALIIGFSAESLIADIVTGLFLLFDNPYNVGDIIEIDSFRGTVTKIGIRTTSIKDTGNNIKIINNSDMRNIINKSNMVSKAVCDISIPIKHDIQAIENNLEELLKNVKNMYPEIIKEDPKYLGIQSLQEESMTIRFVISAEEEYIYKAQRILNREIKIKFQEEGIWIS